MRLDRIDPHVRRHFLAPQCLACLDAPAAFEMQLNHLGSLILCRACLQDLKRLLNAGSQEEEA